jgi:Ca2+-transporting ATPase
MLTGPVFALPLPLLPAQILWVNLVTHGLPGVAIGAEQAEPNVLKRAPRPPQEGMLTRRAGLEVLVLGTTVAGSCLALALWAGTQGRPWQTMLFATLRWLSSGSPSPPGQIAARCGGCRRQATRFSTRRWA